MYNHYVDIDNNNNVISAFSSAFKKPNNNSILVGEKNDRHFNIEIIDFLTGFYNYKYFNNEIIKKEIEEINSELNTDANKIKKIKTERRKILGYASWINGVWVAQEHGHSKGINKKDRILPEALYNDWAVWFEDVSDILNNIDIQNIDYNDIHLGNYEIFPVIPSFPGDIFHK